MAQSVVAGVVLAAVRATGAAASPTAGVLSDAPSSLQIAPLILTAVVATGAATMAARRLVRPPRASSGRRRTRPDHAAVLELTFAPCGHEELMVTELDQELRRLEGRHLDATVELAREQERASRARERGMRALDARDEARVERLDRAASEASARVRLTVEDLGLRSPDALVALEAYRRGDMTAAEVRARWRRLGELTAVERVEAVGRRRRAADPAVESSRERAAARMAFAARDELRIRLAAVAQREAEVEALAAEVGSVSVRLSEARDALERCSHRQQALEATPSRREIELDLPRDVPHPVGS